MSTGNRLEQPKSKAELNRMLGLGDTGELAARSFSLDTEHDIPDLGGISVDGKTVYIDRTFVADLKAGRVRVPGLSWRQVLDVICEHEHIEWAIAAGDNPVDVYEAAHPFALRAEYNELETLGADVERVEESLKPSIRKAERENPKNPPKDLWCSPYTDQPDADDKRVLRRFISKGVIDASKQSKREVHYGFGDTKCRECVMYQQTDKDMSPCDLVCGLVRWDRQCDKWKAR